MKHTLTLDYTIGEGWLTPWVDGLREGQPIASSCSACESAQFPPLRICPNCRIPSDRWTKLEGRAAVQFRTDGSDGAFALARFAGAQGAAVVRVEDLPNTEKYGRLLPAMDGPLVIRLGPEIKK